MAGGLRGVEFGVPAETLLRINPCLLGGSPVFPYTHPVEIHGPRAPRGTARPPLPGARARVLELLKGRPEPVGLAALNAATGLHENTLREHLDALVRDGYAQRHRATPAGRGRPAWLYAVREEPTSEYAALATALAEQLAATASDPPAAGVDAGERWGRRVARGRTTTPDTGRTRTDARTEVLHILEEYDFSPREADGDDVDLTTCPLLEAARRHPDVVCAVHLGLVRGVLAERGVDPTGTSLEPFASPDSCRLTIPRREQA